MTKIDKNFIIKPEECETRPEKTGIRITLASIAGLLALTCAQAKYNKDNAQNEKLTIGGKILPKYNSEIYQNSDDAWLEQNPCIISNISRDQAQYFYDNEFKVVSAGYLYNNEQEIIQSFEEEEDVLSRGGTPVWYGVLTPKGDVTYFRAEDIRGYALPNEKQKTLKKTNNLARN